MLVTVYNAWLSTVLMRNVLQCCIFRLLHSVLYSVLTKSGIAESNVEEKICIDNEFVALELKWRQQ